MVTFVTEVPKFDPDAGEPAYVYARVAEHIAARIAAGELAPGARDVIRDRSRRDQARPALPHRPQPPRPKQLVDDAAAHRQQTHGIRDPVEPDVRRVREAGTGRFRSASDESRLILH